MAEELGRQLLQMHFGAKNSGFSLKLLENYFISNPVPNKYKDQKITLRGINLILSQNLKRHQKKNLKFYLISFNFCRITKESD